jgi:hypothetical protein
MRLRRACPLAAGLLACLPAGALAAGQATTAITTVAQPATLTRGAATTISGTLTPAAGPNVGVLVELQANQGPGRSFVNIAHAITGPAGEFAFTDTRPYRTTRYRVVYDGQHGPAVPVTVRSAAYPSATRVSDAAEFLEGRAGVTAFAVLDSGGRLSGRNLHLRFHSASVVKSMLLVAYLRRLGAERRGLSRRAKALLYPMIHSSSNEAATSVLEVVGEGALDAVAAAAHMSDYEAAGATWGFTEVSAADLARFFDRQESLIPPRFEGYARWLLSTIEPSESWGVPAVARPEFHVYFKGGWLPEVEGLVNQAARLERPGVVFGMAVLTRWDPSMEYGERTIEGVTARLLGSA